ncbi:MAG: MATE family efflux transporter [Bacteroidota bacterium]
MQKSEQLGQAPIGQLLRQQAVPASIGILVMSIYGIVDTIFVGNYVGAVAIGAITVVLPITFLISSIGMAIGIGGSSIISRALGKEDKPHAIRTFGNQVSLNIIIATLVVIAGIFLQDEILKLFGAQGETLVAAQEYFRIILPGVPFLAWAMMANTVIRAEGEPRIAMVSMMVPAIINLILDPVFIIWLDMGLTGAALATSIAYLSAALFTSWYFFFSGRSSMRITWDCLRLRADIVKEIFSLGAVTLARQGVIAILSIILNNALFAYGGALAMSAYGIIQRLMMFANFPVLGITQGFLPIAGYNYGAQKWQRVRQTIRLSLISGTIIASITFAAIMIFTPQIARFFTFEQDLIDLAVPAIRASFLATPLILFQLIGSAYFQAIGKAVPALLLTLTKQGFCLIPLLIILPPIMGLDGIFYAFPIADFISASICFFFLWRQMRSLGGEGELVNPV